MRDQEKQGAGAAEKVAPVELNAPPVQFQMAPSLQSAELLASRVWVAVPEPLMRDEGHPPLNLWGVCGKLSLLLQLLVSDHGLQL